MHIVIFRSGVMGIWQQMPAAQLHFAAERENKCDNFEQIAMYLAKRVESYLGVNKGVVQGKGGMR